MSMSDYWKDFGLGLMNLFDLPGSMVRDIFAWENPLDQIASPFSAKDRATGADVLRNFGVEDPGMLAGMGVEFLLDPLMLAGGLGALKGAKMSAKLGPRYRTTFRKRIENLDDAGSIRVTDERRILPPSDPVERALLREIPPGSKRLGEGFEAMALETPQGGVVRVARSPLHGGNIHSTDIPESAIVESMRIPDVEQMVPVRRHAVIRSDTATPGMAQDIPPGQFPSLGLTPPTGYAGRGSSLGPRSSWLRSQEGPTPSVWTGPHTSDFSIRPSPGAAREARLHGDRMRIRRENWPATNAPDEVVLRHLNVDDQRIIAPLLDAHWTKNVADIQDALGATHEEMVRAMNNFHDARRKLATPTPGHEAIQITHSPKLEEIPDGILTAGQGSDIINAMDDAEKAAYVRRQQLDLNTHESARHQIHGNEFYAWKDQVERQDLDPWDVKDFGPWMEGGEIKGRKMHNLMLDPDTGRAVTNDPGALRETMMPEEYAGRAFHEPTVVDITSNRPIGKKITDMIEDMIWDPITTATGHRARTRAAVAGLEPGMYGKVMPYIAPVIPPSLRMSRPLLGTEEEEPDVLGPL
tara:strand:- start:5865 stop:7607 length:1743 start_codon:yes stop_codon:yes gene_type:complete